MSPTTGNGPKRTVEITAHKRQNMTGILRQAGATPLRFQNIMRLAMGALSALVLIVSAAECAEGAQADASSGGYGAIALSKTAFHYAGSRNYPTEAEAKAAAIKDCGRNDCEVVTWFQNACGALAMAADNAWSIQWGIDQAAADKNALTGCGTHNAPCSIRFHICSAGGEKGSLGGAAPGIYGAIAFSDAARRYAGSRNFSSQAEANAAAIKECERSDCKVAIMFLHACGAVAMAPDNTMSMGKAPDQATVEKLVLSDCAKHSAQCTLRVSVCSGL